MLVLFSFTQLIIIYYVIIVIVSPLIPEFIKSFLGVPLIIFLPYLVGKLIINKLKFRESIILSFIFSWTLGLLIITTIMLIIENTFMIFQLIVHLFLIGTFLLSGKLLLSNKDLPMTQLFSNFLKKYGKINFIIIIFWSVILFLLLHIDCKFPEHLAADELRFSLGTLKIIDEFKIPQLGSYFPYQSVILAIICAMINVHPISIGYWSFLFAYLIYSFSIYFFTYELTRDKIQSIVASLISISVFYVKLANPDFRPLTWIWGLFPFTLLSIYKIFKKIEIVKLHNLIYFLSSIPFMSFVLYYFVFEQLPTLNYNPLIQLFVFWILFIFLIMHMKIIFDWFYAFFIAILLAGLIFLHFPLSGVAIIILYAYILLRLLKLTNNFKMYHFLLLFIFLIVVIPFAQFFPLPKSIFDVPYYSITSTEKKEILLLSYTPIIIIFSLIGILFSFIKKNGEFILISILFLLTLFIIFLKLPILIRGSIFLTPFISVLAGYGIRSILHVSSKLLKKSLTISHYLKKFFIFMSILFLIALLLIPSITFLEDVAIVSSKVQAKTFTKEEFEASLWLRKNFPNALVISDPYTQLVISGISKSQNLGECYMSGKLREIVKKIIITHDSKEAHDLVTLVLSQNITTDYSKIKKDDLFQRESIAIMRGLRFNLNITRMTPFIIITQRTLEWGEKKEVWDTVMTKSYLWENMFPKIEKINESNPSFKKFFDEKYFEQVYNFNYMIYIFKVKTDL